MCVQDVWIGKRTKVVTSQITLAADGTGRIPANQSRLAIAICPNSTDDYSIGTLNGSTFIRVVGLIRGTQPIGSSNPIVYGWFGRTVEWGQFVTNGPAILGTGGQVYDITEIIAQDDVADAVREEGRKHGK